MLTTEDRLAIQSLYARYCASFDLGDVQGWVNCFTEDGLFKSAKDLRGHAQLKEFVEGRIKARADSPNRNVQHWNANLIVEGGDGRAKGMCYIMLAGQSVAANQTVFPVQGTYTDELVEKDGAWRFSVRQMFRDLPPPSTIPRP
jgi:hypothetical protein